MYLVTGAGGGVGSMSRRVVERLLEAGKSVRAMVHHNDVRADRLREIGAEVVAGDLAREHVADDGVQMTLTSTEESRQHRLHWLAEHVMNWSGVPVVHLRPTVFIDNPLFTIFGMASVRAPDVSVAISAALDARTNSRQIAANHELWGSCRSCCLGRRRTSP
jgi:uncharacterized protein YbjT (DUF2867 family)